MSNVLVIGGAGFVGSNLSEILVEKGHNLVVVDNLFLGDAKNLDKIKDKIKFYEHGFEDKEFIEKIIKENRIEYVFHFGGFSSAPHFYGHEAEGMQIAVTGFINLLDACKDNNVKRVLYASTSSVYAGHDIQKEDIKVTPIDFYTLSKYTMEHAARIYNNQHGLESVGFRFFSVYGNHEEHKGRFANLISQFIWAINKDEEVIIYGDGSQTRDFTYVKDICRAIILGMETDSRNAQANVYNIGTSETYTLNRMVDILEEIMSKKAKRKYIVNPIKNYVQYTRASTEKIEKELGFKAEYSLINGIKELVGN